MNALLLRCRTLFFTMAVLLTTFSPAQATPSKWETNGHLYEAVLVPGGLTWQEASDAATAARGHLVTITSAAENDFVYSLMMDPDFWVNGAGGAWMGGLRSAGGWEWVTGEMWDYMNWWPSQPDNAGGTEDHLAFEGGPDNGGAFWNDLTGTVRRSYVVEWDTATWSVNCYMAVLVPGGLTWQEASDAATAAGGHLVTITSAAENDIAYSLMMDPDFWVNGAGGAWMGGLRSAGGWEWVTGEMWDYMNWWPSQPDNAGGTEDHLAFEGGPDNGGAFWNDLTGTVRRSYVVEWEGDCPPIPTRRTTWGHLKALYR